MIYPISPLLSVFFCGTLQQICLQTLQFLPECSGQNRPWKAQFVWEVLSAGEANYSDVCPKALSLLVWGPSHGHGNRRLKMATDALSMACLVKCEVWMMVMKTNPRWGEGVWVYYYYFYHCYYYCYYYYNYCYYYYYCYYYCYCYCYCYYYYYYYYYYFYFYFYYYHYDYDYYYYYYYY